MFLPLNIYDSRKEADVSFISPHWHKEAELTLVVEGKATFKVNKNTYYASKGDVIIISPYNIHSVQAIINSEECFCIKIKLATVLL